MSIIKQTVYLPVKIGDDINTGLIVKYIHNGHKYPINEKQGYFFTPEQLNEFLSDVIKDTLNTAADKAELDYYNGDCRECGQNKINEKSITNTLEETFNKHKV